VNRGLKTVFKVGNSVPVVTGGTQFTYIDVGMNIDCMVAENSPVQNPTISQIKLSLDTSVAAGKPTVVASFDDPVAITKM
jgi:hypothetical protein